MDGKEVNVASKELGNLESAGQRSGKGLKEAERGVKGVGKESNKASINIKKIATSLGLVALGAAAFKTLRAAMDGAISRFDTLNKFPKVLQELGVSAEDSEKAMSRLSDGIDGLPTKLDEIASTAQRMYTSFGDMDKATESAIALNNSLLGSGASADQARRGTEQYLKALQTGKFELDTWNTLSETMDVALVKVAEGFGFAGRSAKMDLYNALKEGIITVDEFNDKLIELGTGTGIMAQLARENSLGLATSITNLRTAFSRGIADIIQSLDKLSKDVTGRNIAENIDGLKVIVNSAFGVVRRTIERATPVVKGFVSVVESAIPVVDKLTPSIIGLMTAYGSYVVITKTIAAVQASNAVLKVAMASTNGLTLATQAKMAAQLASTSATKADIIATAAQTGTVKLSTLAIGVMTGTIKASTAAKVIGTAASYTFGAALRFLTGPVGWVTAGIGALTAGIVAAVKWFRRSTAEAKRLNAETEELGESTENLANEVNSTSEAYEDTQRKIRATAQANRDLARRIDELANKENKSAAEKRLLQSYIEQLNDSVGDLGLAYDEEADKLNMSSKEMQARLVLMREQEKAQEAQQRLTEILREQAEVEERLAETNELREEWNQKLDEGAVKAREHKKAIEELDEQEQLLTETLENLSTQQAETENQIKTSIEAITEATESGIGRQMVAFEDLSETQQKAIESMKSTWEEYQEAATNMFDTLSDEAELTVSEMTENLEENQRIIGEWADNIATLAERGVDEGLLEKLREAGPESAGHVNALVNASDKELEKLSEVFAKGGETATDALTKALGIEETQIMDAIEHLVVGTERTLRDQIMYAGFEKVGLAIPEGLGDGIVDGIGDVEDATSRMVSNTIDKSEQMLEMRSPSRVFRRQGEAVTDGLSLGIEDGTNNVVNAAKKTLQSTINSFSGIKGQFTSIGSNAMLGLNAGLNAGRNRVMATARSIANSVASTMKAALEIRSPSRLMRDEIGKMIPAGIVEGIEGNVDSLYQVLQGMTTKMVEVSSPEIALGRNMSYAGFGGSPMASGNPVTENKYNTVNMDGLFNGAVFNVRDDNDIPRLAKELNDYIKGGARKHGVIIP